MPAPRSTVLCNSLWAAYPATGSERRLILPFPKVVATTTWCVVVGRCPGLNPHSPWRGLEPSSGALSARVPRPEKGDGGGTSSRRDERRAECVLCFVSRIHGRTHGNSEKTAP